MTEAKFVSGSTMQHIMVMTSTAALGLMAIFLVDLADMYFLSLLGETELAAAIGYAGSVLFFTSSLSIGIAIAMGALVARAIGAKEDERAKRYVSTVAVFALVVTTPLALLIWLSVPILLQALGAGGRALELAGDYLRIIVPSMPILALAMASGGVLRAVGAPKLAMYSTLFGGLVNAVLDPLLIFTFGLGVQGAAIASVVARFAVLAVGLYGVAKVHRMVQPCTLRDVKKDLGAIFSIAGPAMLANVATPVGNAYVTASIAQFGDGPVAGYSVIGRVIPVAFGAVFAMSGAIGPIVGQNFGAGYLARVRRSLIDALLLLVIYVGVVSLLLYMGRYQLAALFNAGREATALISFFCTFIALGFGFNGALFTANAAFNNLGRPKWSTLTNWGRSTLGTIPFAWLGARVLGAEGVLAGQAVGGVVFGLIATVVAFRLLRRLQAPTDLPLEHRHGWSFRIPLAAHTPCRGWMGIFRND